MNPSLFRIPLRPARIVRNIQRTGRRLEHSPAATNASTNPNPNNNPNVGTPPTTLNTQPPAQRRAPTAADYQAEIARRAKAKGQITIELQPKTAKERSGDSAVGLTAITLLVLTPFVCYFYYEHRKKHMYEKKMQMLGEAQERYRRATGSAAGS